MTPFSSHELTTLTRITFLSSFLKWQACEDVAVKEVFSICIFHEHVRKTPLILTINRKLSWMYFWYCMISNKDQETLTKKVRLCRTLSSVHGILQAKKKKKKILEWVAIPFSRGSSQTSDRTWVSCIAGRFFPIWATGKWKDRSLQRTHHSAWHRVNHE